MSIRNLEALLCPSDNCMNRERESHVVPAVVAVAGVVAFTILVYLLLTGVDWLLNRLLGSSVGTPF